MSALDGSSAFISRAEDRRKLLWIGRTVFDVILGADDTAGAVSLLDQSGRRGDVTPMHVHNREAEIFYVLEGGVTAWFRDAVHQLDAGGAIYLPPGQPHAFGIRTETARLISVTAPGGFDSFVRAAGMPAAEASPSVWEFDVGRVMQAAPDHGITIVGPPPALPDG
ncbi:MAG: cupin domain-containing protein [Actinomycetota bacterium]|nr:cupin domain-containing protein [Actinomycetota bacterium]